MKKQWLAIPLGGIIVATMLVAFPAVGTTLAAIVTCGSTAPCDGGSNTSTGPGVQGSSRKGNGVYGTTNSPTANAGVFGNDTTVVNTHNAGVKGTSKNGNGVYGYSVNNTGATGQGGLVGVHGIGSVQGLLGESNGDGVVGVTTIDSQFSGVVGHGGTYGVRGDCSFLRVPFCAGVVADGFIGVEASSASGNGTIAVDAHGGFDGVRADGALFGVEASSGDTAVFGMGSLNGIVGANQGNTSGTAILAQGNTATGFLFRGNNSNQKDAFSVDDRGNVYALGQVSAAKFLTHAAASVQQATSTGANVTTFASQVTQADVEHIGEADLVGGVATVHFDPSFAAILAHGHYMVFLTPQGPTQGGLYVSQKGPGGFVVRSENPSARSNVAFDYRVVGRPYSTQLNPGTDTLQRNTPAGPIHGPKMMQRKFPDFRHRLPKPNFKALPVNK